MPRTTREWAKRKLLQSSGNIRTGIEYLREVTDTYADAHPGLAAGLLAATESLDTLREIIEDIEGQI